MEIGPVDLSRRRQVVRRVAIEGARSVGMRQIQEPAPVFVRELFLPLRHRRRIVDRLVAREHAAAHEGIRAGVDVVLEIAVQKPSAMRAVERIHQPVDRPHLDQAPHLAARRETQRDRGHRAEQPVAADRQPEQLGTLGAAAPASCRPARRGRTPRRRRQRAPSSPAAVGVGDERSANRQPSAPVCFCAMPHCRARPR